MSEANLVEYLAFLVSDPVQIVTSTRESRSPIARAERLRQNSNRQNSSRPVPTQFHIDQGLSGCSFLICLFWTFYVCVSYKVFNFRAQNCCQNI